MDKNTLHFRNALIVLAFVLIVVAAVNMAPKKNSDPRTTLTKEAATSAVLPELSTATTSVFLLIADTDALRSKGLGGMLSLHPSQGMLFVFPESARHAFWMKDTNFPLDIIWLDGNFKVLYIEREVAPESFPKTFDPPVLSRYALEVNAGWATEQGLNVGDKFTSNTLFVPR